MQRHTIATTWGRSDLASSDMMSMETTKRVWQARLDPRRNTPSIGIYSHVRDRWGIFHAQLFVLNERQAGVAIEGAVRQERIEKSQLAVDTHGYTDFARALALLLGYGLCPRLKELKQRDTAQMQAVLDRWAHRRQFIPPELNGRIAPTRLEGINLHGVFRFPIERYAAQRLPSQTAAKTSARG